MRKLLIISLTVIILLLSACGKAEVPDCSLSEILDEMVEKTEISGEIRLNAADLLDYYGIKTEDIVDCGALITMNGIFPDEILMIQAKDEASAERVKTSLETRLNEVLNQSKNYDAESYAIAQTCAVDIRGVYVALFVSAKHESMTEIYSTHF